MIIEHLYNFISFSNLSSVSGYRTSRLKRNSHLKLPSQSMTIPTSFTSLSASSMTCKVCRIQKAFYHFSPIKIYMIEPFSSNDVQNKLSFTSSWAYGEILCRQKYFAIATWIFLRRLATVVKFSNSYIFFESLVFKYWELNLNARSASNKKCQLNVCQKNIV